jgi:hypothetical protein
MSYKVELSEEEVIEIVEALRLRSYQIFNLVTSEDLPFPYNSNEVKLMKTKIDSIDNLVIRFDTLKNK